MAVSTPRDWWKGSIVYQIYPRSFCDSNGDGIGDIPGIASKLPYLKNLGVDVIWLSPVYPSPNCDNGYDISDYKDIHPDFGTLKDMDRLISKAKKLGIKIIMDLVINHTSDEHPWFKTAVAGDKKYRDYYYFKDGTSNKKPNNWGSFFGGDAWSKAENGDYYLHLFSSKQPDLNWTNPEVFDEVCDIMRFWLDRGIAGFRCDVINIIYKNSLENGRKRIALTGVEHYLSAEGCHELLKRFRVEIWNTYKPFIVGETVLVNTKMAKDLCDENRQELDEVFFFEHMDVDDFGIKWFRKKYKPQKLIDILNKWQSSLEWPANYLENHDQIRSINHFGDTGRYYKESAKLLCGLNLSLKGTPFIYQGQEIGMTDCDFDSMSELRDYESFNVDRAMKKLGIIKPIRRKLILKNTRDHARTPMQWNSELGAGFTTGIPWIKINSNYINTNVDSEEDDPSSILNFYRDCIDFRKSSEALTSGDYRKVASEKGVYVFTRESLNDRLFIYCNLTREHKLAEIYGDNFVFGNYEVENAKDRVLKPFEFRVLRSNF